MVIENVHRCRFRVGHHQVQSFFAIRRVSHLWCLRSLSWCSCRPSGSSIPPSDSVRAVACAGLGDSGGWYGDGLLAGDGGAPDPAWGDVMPGWIPSMQYGSLNPVDRTREKQNRNVIINFIVESFVIATVAYRILRPTTWSVLLKSTCEIRSSTMDPSTRVHLSIQNTWSNTREIKPFWYECRRTRRAYFVNSFKHSFLFTCDCCGWIDETGKKNVITQASHRGSKMHLKITKT